MGENNFSQNRITFSEGRLNSWKRAFRLTAMVIMPLVVVLMINLFDIENIIQAKEKISGKTIPRENIEISRDDLEIDVSGFIGGEKKYLELLEREDFRALKKINYREAERRMKFDYSQTENLSVGEKEYLEELNREIASYLGYLFGEARYDSRLPLEVHFYSQNYLPKADNCTRLGGSWKESQSVCLSSKDETPIRVDGNWNGSHINKFSYLNNERGQKVINSFESYRINLAIGKDNNKLKKIMSGQSDSCDANGLTKTIAHELTHHYNSIINPGRYEEALAYYGSFAVQRLMADDIISTYLKEKGQISFAQDRNWLIDEDHLGFDSALRDPGLTGAAADLKCLNSQIAEMGAKASSPVEENNLTDYDLAEQLLVQSENLSQSELASCLSSAYKAEVSSKNVFIQTFNFSGAIDACSQGVGSDTIELSQTH